MYILLMVWLKGHMHTSDYWEFMYWEISRQYLRNLNDMKIVQFKNWFESVSLLLLCNQDTSIC